MALSMKDQHESHQMKIGDVFSAVNVAASELDGVTISGGEPFYQQEGLRELLRSIVSNTDLDIMIYSGYTIEELRNKGDIAADILAMTDVLVDGRFEEDADNKKVWRGSDNQRFVILSDRAGKYSGFTEENYSEKRPLMFEVASNNELRIIGIPQRGFLKDLENKLLKKGLGLPTLTKDKVK